MAGYEPSVSLNLTAATVNKNLKNRRTLILAQGTSDGSFTSGALVTGIGNSKGAADSLCGAGSIGALMINRYKAVNKDSQLDAIIVSDNQSGVAAEGSVVISASSPAAGTFDLIVGSGSLNKYTINTTTSSTATTIGDAIESAINEDPNSPVTASNTTGTVTLTAKSKGTEGNAIPIEIGALPSGVTCTITAFSGGVTDPILTGILDKIDTAKYDIVAPVTFLSTIKTHLEAKFNVFNRIIDGIGIVCKTDTYANHQTALAPTTLASKSIAYLCRKLVNDADDKGSEFSELDYVVAAEVAAYRDLCLTPNAITSDFTNVSRGALSQAGLPYQNFKFLQSSIIKTGKGFSYDEIQGLKDLGGSTFSLDDSGVYTVNNLIFTTAYKKNNLTADGLTYRTLNKIDCASIARQLIFERIKFDFSRAAITNGNVPAGVNGVVANEKLLRGAIISYLQELYELGLIQGGTLALEDEWNDQLVVNLDTATGVVSGSIGFKVMGQAESFVFDINVQI